MRWCRFQANGKASYGIVEGDYVQPVAGSPFTKHRRSGKPLALRSVKLLIPVFPPTFYAAGNLNYRYHIQNLEKIIGRKGEVPTEPEIGYRAQSALVAADEPIRVPRDASERIQYEGELVAVIGKPAKRVSKERAAEYILGYTICNDFSDRVWQMSDRGMWRSKNADTFKPLGPWIETDLDLEAARTKVRVNGKELDNFRTADMIFTAADYISKVSQYITFMPGDIITLGTDGVPQNVKHGDVIEIEITGLGTLRNQVLREEV